MLLTRGHYIGQIVDELTSLNQSVHSHGKQHLFDINTHCENFIRDLLNLIHGWNLQNLNRDKANQEGLDLGEKKEKIGIQVTSNAGAPKIHKTLANTNSGDYPTVYVVVVGTKQGSFNLDSTITKPFNFTEQNVWDLDDLVKQIVDKKIHQLKEIFEFLQLNCQRVRIEFEQPNDEGRYKTDMDDYIEPIAKPVLKGVNSYISFHKNLVKEWNLTGDEVESFLKKLIDKLTTIPRITRQLYSTMLERSELEEYNLAIHDGFLRRICDWPDINGEIELLIRARLITDQQQENGAPLWLLLAKDPPRDYIMLLDLRNFALENCGLKRMFVELDFSSLA